MDVATLSLKAQLIGNSTNQLNKQLKESTFIGNDDASSSTISQEAQSSRILSISASDMLSRINEKLGLPANQTESFQNVTPDSTGKFVVDGIKALYENYKKQFGGELTEDQAKNFFTQVDKGVSRGYDDALGTIKEIGADQVNGVMKDVENAKIAIERNLSAFKNDIMKNFEPAPPTDSK